MRPRVSSASRFYKLLSLQLPLMLLPLATFECLQSLNPLHLHATSKLYSRKSNQSTLMAQINVRSGINYWQPANYFKIGPIIQFVPLTYEGSSWEAGDSFHRKPGQIERSRRHLHRVIKRYWLLLRSGARFINLRDKYWLKIWTVPLFFFENPVNISDCHSHSET